MNSSHSDLFLIKRSAIQNMEQRLGNITKLNKHDQGSIESQTRAKKKK